MLQTRTIVLIVVALVALACLVWWRTKHMVAPVVSDRRRPRPRARSEARPWFGHRSLGQHQPRPWSDPSQDDWMYTVSPPTIPDMEYDDESTVRMLPDFEDSDDGGDESSAVRMLPDFEDDDEMAETALPVPRDDLGVMSIPNGDNDVWESTMGEYMSTADPVYPDAD